MIKTVKQAYNLNRFIKFSYRLLSQHKVDVYARVKSINEESFKADILDSRSYTLTAATYRFNQIEDLVILPFLMEENEIYNDQFAQFIAAINFVGLLTQPLQYDFLSEELPPLNHVLNKIKFDESYVFINKVHLALNINQRWIPLILQNVRYNAKGETEYGEYFTYRSLQHKSTKVILDDILPITSDKFLSLFQESDLKAVTLLESFFDENLINKDSFYILSRLKMKHSHVEIDAVSKKPYHPIQLLFDGLSKLNLGKRSYHLPLQKNYLEYFPTIHTSFKHFYSELIIDETFDTITYIKAMIETSILNDEKLLIVVKDEHQLKTVYQHLKQYKYEPLMLSSGVILNDQIGKKIEKSAMKEPLNTTKILKFTQTFEQLRYKLDLLLTLKEFALNTENFSLTISVDSLLNELIHTNQPVLSLKQIKALNGLDNHDIINNVLINHYSRVKTAPYKPIQTLIETNNKSALVNALKDRRLNQLVFSLFKQVIMTRDDLDVLDHASDFHTVVLFDAFDVNPLLALKALNKAAHFTSVLKSTPIKENYKNHPLLNVKGFNFIERIKQTTPTYPVHMHALVNPFSSAIEVIDLETTTEHTKHTSIKNVEPLRSIIKKGTLLLTPFIEDLKHLKKEFKGLPITVQSLHQYQPKKSDKKVMLYLPLHLKTPQRTYDWLKNHPSIIKFFKAEQGLDVSVVLQLKSLKQLSNQKDMLYYYLVKQHLTNDTDKNQLKTMFDQGITAFKTKKRSCGKALTLSNYETSITINNLNNPQDILSLDDITYDTLHWFLKNQ